MLELPFVVERMRWTMPGVDGDDDDEGRDDDEEMGRAGEGGRRRRRGRRRSLHGRVSLKANG